MFDSFSRCGRFVTIVDTFCECASFGVVLRLFVYLIATVSSFFLVFSDGTFIALVGLVFVNVTDSYCIDTLSPLNGAYPYDVGVYSSRWRHHYHSHTAMLV